MISCDHLYCLLQVNRVLKVLENPYSDAFGQDPLHELGACGDNEQEGEVLNAGYVRKPPAWAQRICIT